ncbi:cell wall protein Ecm33 [Elasticomyces elasticus]|uniref:Cell wall protein Ecm33 n=1 Tax=Exophiala sideris TaxID=1016849 RepID=A0ABR0IWT7_9EURO|nr:cell wall protein Ecm33 [Elasticomyces elasticus]KAK5021738.1 cell wall protein Ecm33 [Exophiala sideris]KAK5025105.1 cell wall protein Ecm33 [Exophiala sideris]KAK5050170.1 cell wall protein Ecm33 [Exophiala sideris]KAK5176918.1 cell wall protein Ecm33 [Eurotiomycetes sp. CCFEE 6388]
MAFTKFILPALAIASTVLAQTSTSVCDGPSVTIASSADAQQIASCSTYNGDVVIDSTASGQIAINGVQQIKGDLTCNNATQLTAITSDQLGTITGTFSLTGLTILSTLQFNSLNAVNIINWVGLPALQSLNFNQGVSQANQVYISNTELNNVDGIELTAVGSMNINNNPYLTDVNVNDLTNVTTSLSFSANGKDLEISFPNLQDAANLTFINVSSVNMPSLATVSGSMGFYSDTFQSFAAPNLTSTGGTLAFVDCGSLSNVSFPSLTQIGGGFLVANNTKLTAISGFPKLKTVVGAIDFAGSFGSVAMPSLTDVRGGSNVQTTSTNTTICDLFNQAHSAGVIKGVNTCITGKANPDTNPSSTSGGSSSTSTSTSGSKNDGVTFYPSTSLTGLGAILAAIFFF